MSNIWQYQITDLDAAYAWAHTQNIENYLGNPDFQEDEGIVRLGVVDTAGVMAVFAVLLIGVGIGGIELWLSWDNNRPHQANQTAGVYRIQVVSDPTSSPWKYSAATSPLPTPTRTPSTWKEEYRRAKLEKSTGVAVHKGNEVRIINPTSFEISWENVPVRNGKTEVYMSAWGTDMFYFVSPSDEIYPSKYMRHSLGRFVANNQPAEHYLGLSGDQLEPGIWTVLRFDFEHQIDAQFSVRDGLEGVITIGYEFLTVQRSKMGFLP